MYPTQEELEAMADAADKFADEATQSPGEYHPDWHTCQQQDFARRIIDWQNAKLAEQEPVAWRYRFKNASGWGAWVTTPYGAKKPENVAFDDIELIPLYTCPQAAQEWIRVKDRLPADGQWIIGQNADGCCWHEQFDADEPIRFMVRWIPAPKEQGK